MKTKPEWLREFADAMEKDQIGWWRGYEYFAMVLNYWCEPDDEQHFMERFFDFGYQIRRKPRTVTRFDRNGERLELPEPLRERLKVNQRYWTMFALWDTATYVCRSDEADAHYFQSGNCFATREDAQAWADYFRSLLENRDD